MALVETEAVLDERLETLGVRRIVRVGELAVGDGQGETASCALALEGRDAVCDRVGCAPD